jgi:hypothetical protein
MKRAISTVSVLAFALAFAAAAWAALSQPPVPPAGSCHAHHALPDATCTPGARDRGVTQANIKRTICRTGYTKTVRPPTSYTTTLKRRQLASYGYYAGRSLSAYEEDHLISLELGGSPTAEKNLWPEAHAPKPGSFQKDTVENSLHRQVCAGQIKLSTAQREIARNWLKVYREIHP